MGLVFQEEKESVQSARNNENVNIAHSFWLMLIGYYSKAFSTPLLSTIKIKKIPIMFIIKTKIGCLCLAYY